MGPPSDGTPPGAANGNTFQNGKSSSLPKDTPPIANGGQLNSSAPQRSGRSMDAPRPQERQLDPSSEVDPRQRPGKVRRPSDKQRICGKCGTHLTGQFVRALGDTYHLECFTCHVCIAPYREGITPRMHTDDGDDCRTATK